MKKLSLIFIFLTVPFFFIHAQNLSIGGQLTDQTKEPLIGASVVLLNPNDSSLIKGSVADVDGNFSIENVQPANYLVRISFIGYEDLFISKQLTTASINLGRLVLKEKATKLNQVTIIGAVVPVQQKGDTTQINASAYKTNPDATAEDLINKMPGITLQNGKIQAQGEDVQKVLVDGKTFFGDDANAVLKNLPSEVIDKIQIFDKKSDQSQFTGFDDGNTSKTINIVTKTRFRNGTFGKVYGGYGNEDKWKAGANLNFFKDERRLTLLANTNNINDQNFSSEDLLGVISGKNSGGGNRGGGRPGKQSDIGNFLVDQKSGITTTNSFGINYANKWKNVELSGSYFLNNSENNSTSDLFRQYVSNSSSGITYTENSINKSTNTNHRLNLKLDWKIDSSNSFLFQPKLSYQANEGNSSLNGETEQFTSALSNASSMYNSNLHGINFSAPLLYRHSFIKKGRTISLSVSPGYNQNEGNAALNSYTTNYNDSMSTSAIHQQSSRNIQGLTLSSSIVYTEPISTKSQLMVTYKNNFNKNESVKETYNVSPTDGNYKKFDSLFSNNFNNNYLSQSIGTGYRYQQVKWNAGIGFSYQYAQLVAQELFPINYEVNKAFNNFLPDARFQYKFTDKKIMRLFYRTQNNVPSVSQLQNVIDNSNPLQLSTGNPNLKQDFQNNLFLRYNSANTVKSTSFFALISGTYANNYIVNNTFIAKRDTLIAPSIILASGSQFSKPINLNGYYTLRSFNNYSLPLKVIKSNLNLNLGGTYTHTPSMINNQLNYSNSYNAGLGLAISSNISEKFDFTISSNTTYNNISNTLQKALNSTYYNQSSKLKIQVMTWKGLVLQTDITHQYNSGLSQNFNQNFILWNAAIAYKFLKNKQADLRLSVFDILKQNNSITRNTSETYYEDVKTNVLKQYFLLTFTYNIKYYTQTKNAE
ncbi:MAG: TonB-dependent receptor [Bacteroidia bacterium]